MTSKRFVGATLATALLAVPSVADPASQPVPAFANLESDLYSLYTTYTKLGHAGSFYESRGGTPIVTMVDGASAMDDWQRLIGEHSFLVLDADANADAEHRPRRPRILCRSLDYQLALYVDAAMLRTVTTTSAIAFPSRAEMTTTGVAATPGLHLPAGTEVTALERNGGAVRVRYASPSITAEGWLPADGVGITFGASHELDLPKSDGELKSDLKSVAVFAAAKGSTFATLHDIKAGPFFGFHRFDKAHQGWSLAKFEDFAAPTYLTATLVGWVKDAALDKVAIVKPEELGVIRIERDEFRRSYGAKPYMVIPDKTLFTSMETGEVIGASRGPQPFECDGECKGPSTPILVDACGIRAIVRPVAPH